MTFVLCLPKVVLASWRSSDGRNFFQEYIYSFPYCFRVFLLFFPPFNSSPGVDGCPTTFPPFVFLWCIGSASSTTDSSPGWCVRGLWMTPVERVRRESCLYEQI